MIHGIAAGLIILVESPGWSSEWSAALLSLRAVVDAMRLRLGRPDHFVVLSCLLEEWLIGDTPIDRRWPRTSTPFAPHTSPALLSVTGTDLEVSDNGRTAWVAVGGPPRSAFLA